MNIPIITFSNKKRTETTLFQCVPWKFDLKKIHPIFKKMDAMKKKDRFPERNEDKTKN